VTVMNISLAVDLTGWLGLFGAAIRCLRGFQAWYGFGQIGYVMAIPREVETTISEAKLGRGRSRQHG